MVEIKALADGIFVSGQVCLADLAELGARFRTIINNRPDGEEADQPASANIEAEARGKGLEYSFIPITPGQFTEQQIFGLRQVLADAPRPVLAFCRTGARSTSLWALSEAGNRPADEIVAIAIAAGYDLSALRTALESKVASR